LTPHPPPLSEEDLAVILSALRIFKKGQTKTFQIDRLIQKIETVLGVEVFYDYKEK
jgi:hypothetical protein